MNSPSELSELARFERNETNMAVCYIQEVAIKRMKAAITKEFLAEIKVLCKFHHTNLVIIIQIPNAITERVEINKNGSHCASVVLQNELYGYSSHGDDLFVVYEYAEHRALADRLHEPILKGIPNPCFVVQRYYLECGFLNTMLPFFLHRIDTTYMEYESANRIRYCKGFGIYS
jgi:serine/threonine protein kinase